MGALIVNGIKWAFVISIATVFASSITSLLNLLVSVTFANVIGEALGLVSMYLPFDGSVVFGGLVSVFSGILSFIVSRKLYLLLGNKVTV